MTFHYLKHILFLLLSAITLTVSAANIGKATLDNGTIVLLHDDYTWEYVAINAVADKKDTALADITIPTHVTPSNPASATEDKSSLLHSGLLHTAVKNDVKVTYTDAVWREQSVGLTFGLSSNNDDGVVIVKVIVTFFDDNAKKLTERTINIWQASYRLPDTYLRKGEPRESRVIWIDGVDKANWSNQLLSLKVVEVETR